MSAFVLGEVIPDSKVLGANMVPTWVLSAPDGPHVGPRNFAIGDITVVHIIFAVSYFLKTKAHKGLNSARGKPELALSQSTM